MKKIILTTIALSAFAFAAAPASYATCKACHGVKGEINVTTQSKSFVPANQTKENIVKALNGYKDGSYGGAMKAIMKPHVEKKSDAELEALASLISKM